MSVTCNVCHVLQVSRLEERVNVCKGEAENAKRDLKNEQEGRTIVDKQLKCIFIIILNYVLHTLFVR